MKSDNSEIREFHRPDPVKIGDRNVYTHGNPITNARYKWDPLEKKVFSLIISKIKMTDKDLKPIGPFHFSDIADKVSDVHNLKRIIEVCKALQRKPMEIPIEDEKTGAISRLGIGNVIIYADLDLVNYTVIFTLNDRLKPYLIDLNKNFKSYYLENIIGMKSFYSMRLYELLKQYEKIGIRRFTLGELRETLGIGETEYSLFTNFRVRVLEQARREINSMTDIMIDYKPEFSRNKKIVALVFRVQKKGGTPAAEGPKKVRTFDRLNSETQGILYQDAEKINPPEMFGEGFLAEGKREAAIFKAAVKLARERGFIY